jgi:hypothetical protein
MGQLSLTPPMAGRLFQNRTTEPIYSTISSTYTYEFFISFLMTQDPTQMQGKSEIKSSNGCRSFSFADPKNSTLEKVNR